MNRDELLDGYALYRLQKVEDPDPEALEPGRYALVDVKHGRRLAREIVVSEDGEVLEG